MIDLLVIFSYNYLCVLGVIILLNVEFMVRKSLESKQKHDLFAMLSAT